MLEVARRLAADRGVANVTFTLASAERLPYPDSTFDIAISRFSIHHWPRPEEGFREIGRVLRPGGRLALVDLLAPEDGPLDSFLNAVELLRDPSHARSLRASEWLAGLRSAGLTVDVERTWDLEHDTEAWLATTAPTQWRAAAVRALLRDAPPAARGHFGIPPDGSLFRVGCGLILGRRD